MMNCPKCNASMREGARFCSTCGFDTSTPEGISTSESSQTPSDSTQPDQENSQPAQPLPQQAYSQPPPQAYQYPQQNQPQQGYPLTQQNQPQQGYPYTQQNQPQQGYPYTQQQVQQPYPPNGQQNWQNSYQGPVTPVLQKKKRGCLRIPLVMLLILLIMAGGAYAAYSMVLPLPVKWAYGIAGYRTLSSTYDDFDDQMDRFEDLILKPIMEEAYSQSLELGIQPDVNTLALLMGTDPASASQIAEMAGAFTLKTTLSGDVPNEKSLTDLVISMYGNPFVGMNVTMYGDRVGLLIPELSSTRIVADMNSSEALDRISAMSGGMIGNPYGQTAPIDPWVANSYYEEIGIDRAELKKMVLDYALAAYKALPAKALSQEKGVTATVLGNKVSLHEISMELTEDDLREITLGILRHMEQDERIHTLFLANLDSFFRIMGETNPDLQYEMDSLRNDLTQEAFREQLATSIEELENEPASRNRKPVFIMRAYLDGPMIVRHEFEIIHDTGTLTEPAIVGLDRIRKGNRIERALTLDVVEEYGDHIEATIQWASEYNASASTHSNEIAFQMVVTSDYENTKIDMHLDSIETPDGRNKAIRTLDGALLVSIEGYDPTQFNVKLTGGGPVERDAKGRLTLANQEMNVSMTGSDVPGQLSFKALAKQTLTYGKDVKFPTDTGKTLNLETATEEDLQLMMQELMMNAETLAEQFSEMAY